MVKTKLFSPSTVVILIVAFITYVLTEVAVAYADVVERVYSQGVYTYIAQVLSFLSQWVAFSMDDVFYMLLILALIGIMVLLLIRQLSWWKALVYLIRTIALVYIAFYWLWGFNYFRLDLNKRLNLVEAKADPIELMTTFQWLINEVNNNYIQMDSVSSGLLVKQIEAEYYKGSEFLKIDKSLCNTRPKSITFSCFFAAATISGYYGPFFSEVHINSYLMPVELPLVLAHELAHRYGVTGEAEANFYAWYICTHSDSRQLKYSAYLYLLRYFVFATYQLEGFEQAIEALRSEVINDYRNVTRHWLALMNKNVEEMASTVNDAYLKTNKVEEGINDYEGVVKFVMDYRTSVKNN